MRILNLSDGFTASGAPTEGDASGNALRTYASDAAFVSANGTAQVGDCYINTTDGYIHYYNGSAWVTVYPKSNEVPVWSSTVTYSRGSIVNDDGVLYSSLQNNNLNHALSDTSYWQLVTNVTPEMFGAVGNGSTDDTDAIQDAFDYVIAAGGGTVEFRRQYAITSVTVSGTDDANYAQNIRMIGKPGAKIISTNPPAVSLPNTWGPLMFIWVDNLVIEGMIFDGNRENIAGTSNTTVNHCVTIFSCNNVWIRNNYFTGPGREPTTGTDWQGDGVYINASGDACQNIFITDNIFTDIGRWAVAQSGPGSNIQIARNKHFEYSVAGTGTRTAGGDVIGFVDIEPNVDTDVTDFISIENNVCQGPTLIAFSRGSSATHTAKGIVVQGNILDGNYLDTGTHTGPDAGGVRFWHVEGGVIANNVIKTYGSCAGIELSRTTTKDIVVTGNKVTTVNDSIYINSFGSKLTISNNYCEQTDSSSFSALNGNSNNIDFMMMIGNTFRTSHASNTQFPVRGLGIGKGVAMGNFISSASSTRGSLTLRSNGSWIGNSADVAMQFATGSGVTNALFGLNNHTQHSDYGALEGALLLLPSRGNSETWGSAAPTSGDWARGDIVWNTGASAGGSPGWVCTTAGSPGTWKAMANVAA